MSEIDQAVSAILAYHHNGEMISQESCVLIYRYLRILKWLKEGYYEISTETQIEGPPLFLYTCKVCGFGWYSDHPEKHSESCIILDFLRE